MTPVVEVDRVSKSFGAQPVLQELSFSIERGEIFCLLGPNGAGKTTTLEILEGFLAPDAGAVRVLGHDPITFGGTLRQRVGVVLQESGFPKYLRAGEMIETWRSYYLDPLPYDEILDLVGLRSDETKLVRKLGWAAPATRLRPGRCGGSRGHLSRRANNRLRSRGTSALLGDHCRSARSRQDGTAHYSLSR